VFDLGDDTGTIEDILIETPLKCSSVPEKVQFFKELILLENEDVL